MEQLQQVRDQVSSEGDRGQMTPSVLISKLFLEFTKNKGVESEEIVERVEIIENIDSVETKRV